MRITMLRIASLSSLAYRGCHRWPHEFRDLRGAGGAPLLLLRVVEGSKGFGQLPTFFRGPSSRKFHHHAVRAAVQPDKSRGGLPRFHVETLPVLKGTVALVEGDEFSHMTRVLRLKVNDRVELFDGRGGIVNGQLSSVSRSAAEVTTMESVRMLSPVGPYWHVAAAFCTLKGGRGEWLVEKCTGSYIILAILPDAVGDKQELGARTLTPLLTQRSSSVSGGRTDRWQRIAKAATKQCQRLHALDIREPILFQSFLQKVSEEEIALVASAEAPPLFERLLKIPSMSKGGLLIIGPEGDFTPDEIDSLVNMGARPVGLGPRRLRVETAAVAMLAAVMLMVDTRSMYSQIHKATLEERV